MVEISFNSPVENEQVKADLTLLKKVLVLDHHHGVQPWCETWLEQSGTSTRMTPVTNHQNRIRFSYSSPSFPLHNRTSRLSFHCCQWKGLECSHCHSDSTHLRLNFLRYSTGSNHHHPSHRRHHPSRHQRGRDEPSTARRGGRRARQEDVLTWLAVK